jgi:hypothetical protein
VGDPAWAKDAAAKHFEERKTPWNGLVRMEGRPLEIDMDVFRRWIPVVRRYSFCCDEAARTIESGSG